MNVSTAAKMLALAATTLGLVVATGCAAPVETGTVDGSQLVTPEVQAERTPNFTVIIPGTTSCQYGSIVGSTDPFLSDVVALGCTTNPAMLQQQITPTTATRFFEVECPVSAQSKIAAKWTGIAPYNPTWSSTSARSCVNSTTGVAGPVYSISAPSGYVFLDYDPHGCGGNCIT